MNFIFSCSIRYLRTLEDKIHIHAQACNILYISGGVIISIYLPIQAFRVVITVEEASSQGPVV